VRSVRAFHSGWSLRGGEHEVPAEVPGCVHTDLLAAGAIPDPFADSNEDLLHWIGRTDWTYATEFDHAPDDAVPDGAVADRAPDSAERVELVCRGLDTVATVVLNGVELGRTENMHRSYRFDVTRLLQAHNRLEVRFESPYGYVERVRDAVGERPGAYNEPYQYIRKMASNFGWDWGPTVVTSGIWQPIGLESWSTARLAEVVPRVDATGQVEVHVNIARTGDTPVTVTASVGEVTTVAGVDGDTATVRLTVVDPELWWPRGLGKQPLYPLRVQLRDATGRTLDTWERRIGFRDVTVDTSEDEHGSRYTIVVNGTPVFARGFNWIPDDAFITRVTRERLARRFADACEANANYLRVWGGGRYESDDFYELADELGILVGQDFLFACAAYPEEEPIRREVEAEAREQVARLASHPSLVMWTGNNENVWGWHDWGWQDRLGDRSWGAGFYFDLLPRVVAEVDPTRFYWPSSPWSGRADLHPNDPDHGTAHEWEVWNRVDYVHYRRTVPRFMSEFGYQAPPAFSTLRRWLSDEPLAHDSPGMAHHQKADDGDAKLRKGLDDHLPAPRDFADWHFLTQVGQARAVGLGIRHYRSHRGRCMGALVWQLNDNWPVTSWAAVDHSGQRKPLWHETRRAFAPRLLTIEPRGPGLALVAVNDGTTAWSGEGTVTRYGFDGSPLSKNTVAIDAGPGSAATVALPDEPAEGLLLAEIGGERAWWFFAEDREGCLPEALFTAAAVAVPGGYAVTVTAGSLLRDVALFPDRLDSLSTVDDALVTLLPGESHTFRVTSVATLDPAALTARPVLRCVNDIVG
jgi:beta-mannosidase